MYVQVYKSNVLYVYIYIPIQIILKDVICFEVVVIWVTMLMIFREKRRNFGKILLTLKLATDNVYQLYAVNVFGCSKYHLISFVCFKLVIDMQSRRLSRVVSHVTYFRNFKRYIEFLYNNKRETPVSRKLGNKLYYTATNLKP